MKKLVFLILLLGCLNMVAKAQYEKLEKPSPPFITLIEVGAGTTSIELGLSGRVNDKIATGLFAMGFHNSNLTEIMSNYMIGARIKRYVIDMRPEPYLGAMVGAHRFRNGIHPFAGINVGFDIYAGDNVYGDEILTKFGLDVGVGVDAAGRSFFGATVSFGLGFTNNKSEPYNYY